MNKTNVIFLLLSLLLILCGCEETLPFRNDPTNALTVSVRTLYVYNTPIEHSLYFFLVVKNNYDETIEAKAAIDGKLRIKWRPPAEYTVGFVDEKNVELTLKDIQTGNYNGKNGLLLIGPGDSLVLMYRWDFVTDDKTDMLLKFGYFVDKSCFVKGYPKGARSYRQISEKQIFEVTANVTLFVQTSILYAQPYVVNQCFVSRDFGEWDHKFEPCIPIDPNNPCSVLQPP
jgi:hypothetical protein